MSKKTSFLIIVALTLAAAYVFFFTDWLRTPTVKIFHTCRNMSVRHHKGQDVSAPNLIFGLNQSSRLTEIKVVPLTEYQANPNTLPLWHLISDSNSVPVKVFYYGQFIHGLKPAVAGSRPQTLTNHVTYRILVSVGKIKGEHDFELK